MKTVVITGSARGFGYAMLEEFYKKNYNVVLCDVNIDELDKAMEKLSHVRSNGKILSYKMDVTNEEEVKSVIDSIKSKGYKIDIWINNAGVNQPMKPIWELDTKTIDRLLEIVLKGTILCSKLIMPVMIEQKSGEIYNVEGHGSNDATITGLSIYGTAKRAVTYFTESLAKESNDNGGYVSVGKITPGIMITNFIGRSLGDGEKIELDEKTKNIYNILGDKPEVIARFMVNKIHFNKKKHPKFVWLTTGKAMGRFMSAIFGRKNNYFDV
ncbi:MAG: SDR family oxidoreductase [Bacilli bacterium]|nr:SDR family oxidoreductase [Bacilli bacterium]